MYESPELSESRFLQSKLRELKGKYAELQKRHRSESLQLTNTTLRKQVRTEEDETEELQRLREEERVMSQLLQEKDRRSIQSRIAGTKNEVRAVRQAISSIRIRSKSTKTEPVISNEMFYLSEQLKKYQDKREILLKKLQAVFGHEKYLEMKGIRLDRYCYELEVQYSRAMEQLGSFLEHKHNQERYETIARRAGEALAIKKQTGVLYRQKVRRVEQAERRLAQYGKNLAVLDAQIREQRLIIKQFNILRGEKEESESDFQY